MQGQSREEDKIVFIFWKILTGRLFWISSLLEEGEIKENKIICLRQGSNLTGVWWIKKALI